jgi:hypothetical protein
VNAGHRAAEALGILERHGGETGLGRGTTTGLTESERRNRR